MFRNMLPPPMQNMVNLIQQAQQIQRNPQMLATLLQQRGMITPQQAKDIQTMGNNYEQVGQYLIQNGKMPSNVQPYEGQVSQVQHMMKN
jgi:mannitol/fructose-specific phosphotransferase system IIA component (Ntr-type)